jgi:uncharacterized protein (UPF0332 family)
MMATWQEIGQDNFRAGRELFDRKRYRSAVSRFYYAVFSVVTDELIRRNAYPDFRDKRATPGHSQLPNLMESYFTHFSDERQKHLRDYVKSVYRDRIGADYSLLRVDKQTAKESYRATEKVFRYLGVDYGTG